MSNYGVVQWSQTASADSSADVNVYIAEGMAPSATNDQFRAIMQSVAKYRDDNSGILVTGGTSSAATLTTEQVFAALTNGLTVTVALTKTLDANASLAVDGLTTAAVQLYSTTAITTGTLVAGAIVGLTYTTSAAGVSTAPVWLVNTPVQFGVGNLLSLTLTDQEILSGGARTPAVAISQTTLVQFDYGFGPMRSLNNTKAFVFRAPANDGYAAVLVSNTTSAGTITTSGFTVSANVGDAVTTSSGNKYVWNFITINGVSTYMVKALQ